MKYYEMIKEIKEVRGGAEVCSSVHHILLCSFENYEKEHFITFSLNSDHYRHPYFYFIQIIFGHYLIEFF